MVWKWKKEIESSFQDEIERGLVTEWYKNGLNREERTFKQILTYTDKGMEKREKRIKKLFTYYDTGNIKREKNYRSGKKWGLEFWFLLNTFLFQKTAYHHRIFPKR